MGALDVSGMDVCTVDGCSGDMVVTIPDSTNFCSSSVILSGGGGAIGGALTFIVDWGDSGFVMVSKRSSLSVVTEEMIFEKLS